MAPLDADKFKTPQDKYKEFKRAFCEKYSNIKAWGKHDSVISGKRITSVGELLEYLEDTEEYLSEYWGNEKLREKVSQDNIDLLLGKVVPIPPEILKLLAIIF